VSAYKPTDGSKQTQVVPVIADTERVHEFEVTAEFQAADAGCGQRAGWYLLEARLMARSGKRSRKVELERWREEQIMDLFDRFMADYADGYDS